MAKAKHWMADLLIRVLPIWRGQVGYACELMETTIIGLTLKFSEIVKELDRVASKGRVWLDGSKARDTVDAQQSLECGISGIKALISNGDTVSALQALDELEARIRAQQLAYEETISEINQANGVIKTQIEEVLVDLQFQDRVSQILRQVIQAQHQLDDVVKEDLKLAVKGKGLRDFDADEWIERLQESYAMEDQVRIHNGNRQSESKKVDEITFF